MATTTSILKDSLENSAPPRSPVEAHSPPAINQLFLMDSTESECEQINPNDEDWPQAMIPHDSSHNESGRSSSAFAVPSPIHLLLSNRTGSGGETPSPPPGSAPPAPSPFASFSHPSCTAGGSASLAPIVTQPLTTGASSPLSNLLSSKFNYFLRFQPTSALAKQQKPTKCNLLFAGDDKVGKTGD